MKNILNYATVQDFIKAEGPQMGARGYVTSITPGVGYVKEVKATAYNKPMEITFNIFSSDPAVQIDSTGEENLITSVTFNSKTTCEKLWNLLLQSHVSAPGTEPTPRGDTTYYMYCQGHRPSNSIEYAEFRFKWGITEEPDRRSICQKVQALADIGILIGIESESPIIMPPFYDSTTGKFNKYYDGWNFTVFIEGFIDPIVK